jgi:hypothetical protein
MSDRLFKKRSLYNYDYVLDHLQLHTLFARLRYFEVLFMRNIYNGCIICSSLLEAAGIRVPVKCISD